MRRIVVSIIAIAVSLAAFAVSVPRDSVAEVTESLTVFNIVNDTIAIPELPDPAGSHFTWGASLGSSIDMTSQDMTAINLDACFGYKNAIFNIIGVGAGVKMMANNNSRCYPIYFISRTSFTKRPALCFGEIKAGVSINNFYNDIFQRRFYGSLGVGVTLAHSRKFNSFVILSYEFMAAQRREVPDVVKPLSDIHSASIVIGCSF